MVTMVTTVALVAYNIKHDHGPRLSPGLVHAQTYITTMLNILFFIYITRNMRGCAGWAAFPKALPCPRRSRGQLLLSEKFLTNKQVTRGSLQLGHMLHSHSLLIKHVICQLQITVCHVSIRSTMSSVQSSTSSSVRTIQLASLFCLFAILNRTRYLSLLTSV
jgi:hypothetical protein